MKRNAVRDLWWLVACAAGVLCAAEASAQKGARNGEWRNHGGDSGHSQYSPLDQIDKDNIEKLEIVWRWKSIDEDLRNENPELRSSTRIYKHEVTPLKVGDRLYVSTSLGQIAALDPKTGETLWSYDPKTWDGGRMTNLGFLSRGLSYWTDGVEERLFHAHGSKATLVSIDAATGKPDPGFGEGGKVDLTQGLGPYVSPRTFTVTAPPIICRGVVIVGSSIRDTPTRREIPPGHVRGYDARNGKLLWTFHTIPQPGEFGNETWEDDSWKTAGAVNVWTMMTADRELGYVYLPIGTPSHNWYGGHRPGDNLFACSIVCLDARTGERVWHFQLIRHPVWDWDPPAAPTLIDITVEGKPIKAVAVVTKQGFLFTFDRETGKPVWPIEEREAPGSTVPGEKTAATQPFPTKPAAFERQGFLREDIIDFTDDIKAAAFNELEGVEGGPLYTPPSQNGTIINPGWSGGANWNGAPFDPETEILYVPSWTDWNLVKLVKPDAERSNFDYVWGGMSVPKVRGLPIFKPPYGRITAISMKTGEHLWQVANGDGPRDHELLKDLNLPPLGTRCESFPVLTKTLLFATTDKDDWNAPTMRVFDKTSGRVLREIELPASVHATPMTYMHEGKQYIAVAVGGGRSPDEIVALALP